MLTPGLPFSLDLLKRENPKWAWRGVRNGFGWAYVGTCGQRTIEVRRCAQIVGPSDDDFATVWMVDDGQATQSYASWWLKEYAAADHERTNT
jgi:hypothetical protein